MSSHSFTSIVNRIAPYVIGFVGFTTLGGAMYGAYLGYNASVSAPNYTEAMRCMAFGSIVGARYGPAYVLSLPFTTTINGIPEFKVIYNNGVIVSFIPK